MTTGTSEIYSGVSFAGSRLGIDNFQAAYKAVSLDRRDLAVDFMRQLSELPAFPKLDFFYLPAAINEGAALLNLLDYQKAKLTKSASGLSFAADVGFTGDALSGGGILSTGLQVANLKASQNDISFGVHLANGGTVSAGNVAISLGAVAFLIPGSASNTYRARVNGSATTDLPFAGARTGHWWARRNNSADFDVRRPDGVIVNTTQASAAPSGEVSLLGSAAGATLRSDATIRAAWGGKAVTDAEAVAIVALIDGWFAAIV